MTRALSLVLFILAIANLPGLECIPATVEPRVFGDGPPPDGDHFFLGAFGWFIQDRNHPEAGFNFKCSIIIIDQKTVLTHAQKECYRVKDGKSDYNPDHYAVTIGNKIRPNNEGWIKEEDTRGGQGILIEQILPHPCFKEGEYNEHNIAILKLKKYIRYTSTQDGKLSVYPVVLPYYNELQEHIKMNGDVWIYGWDKKNLGHLKTKIMPYEECRKKGGYRNSKKWISENAFCTMERGKGACLYDGGTAVIGRRKTGHRVLLGMVNLVQGKCTIEEGRNDTLADIHLDVTKYGCSIYENWMHITQDKCTSMNGDCTVPPDPPGPYISSTRVPVTAWTETGDPVLPSEITATTGPGGSTIPNFSTTNEPTDKTTDDDSGETPVPAGRGGHMEIPIFGIFAATLAVIISNY